MIKAEEIVEVMLSMGNSEQAEQLRRFFKTAPGQYGYGDKFIGLKNPQTKLVVRAVKNEVSLSDAVELIHSEWHEARYAGFLLMAELFNKAGRRKDDASQREIIRTYLQNITYCNNWDLVDCICPHILGEWLVSHPEDTPILYELAESDNLWKKRVSIVTNWMLIRHGRFDVIKRLAVFHIDHPHDLIHKSIGWMLREMGKRDETQLLDFLDEYATRLPRTALRYALEKVRPETKQYYMTLK